jgi:glycosyltransferase involved in cell wall biosynthesis
MILWRVTSADPTIASLRYRAAFPALHLAALGYQSRFSNRHEPLPTRDVDAVIFVKAFSQDDLKAAERAHRRRIPIVLDICDNIFVEGYSSFGARPESFRHMASIASAVVTTGSALAGVVRKETGDSRAVMIVPDCAETEAEQEQIRRILYEWQLYGRFKRAYFRVRAQMREHGVLFTCAHAISQGAAWADRLPGRPFRYITPVGRAIFRTSRLGVKHARSLSKTVLRRISEEGLRWIGRGITRRTRLLVGRLTNVVTKAPVATETLLMTNPPAQMDVVVSNGGKGARGDAVRQYESGAAPVRKNNAWERTLIWFGNHGASYSHFGLADLADLQPALCKISERHAIRLIVISNSEARYNKLIRPFPFATHYIPWRLGVVEDWLKQSEIALLPNSLDAFNVCKSANRAALALSHGVPVVATRTPALAPLEDCVIFDDWVRGIETYLCNPQLVKRHIADAQVVIEREFSGERIARKWDALLRQVVSERSSVQGYRQPNLIDDSR